MRSIYPTIFITLLFPAACGEPCGVPTVSPTGLIIAAEECPDVDDTGASESSSESGETGPTGGDLVCFGQPCGATLGDCEDGLLCVDLGDVGRCFAPCIAGFCESAGKISCDPDGVGGLGVCELGDIVCGPVLCDDQQACPRGHTCWDGICY